MILKIFSFFSSLKNPRKLGAFAMHLGALLVLTGGIITAIYGKIGFIGLNTGEMKQYFINFNGAREPLKFKVRLDKFILSDMKATISIIENDGHTTQGTLQINHPFKYRDYFFYQAGYDPSHPDWTSVAIDKDAGVQIVFVGFFLLNVGAVLSAIFAMRKEFQISKENF